MVNLEPALPTIRALQPGPAAGAPKPPPALAAPPAVEVTGAITQRFGSDAVEALKASQSTLAELDRAIARLQTTLNNLRLAANSGSAPAPAAQGAQGAASTNADHLTIELQSLINARSAIAASAQNVYQSFINSTPADGLIAGINVASGRINFNLQQTLLQMQGDVLLGRSTISTLVHFLLQ